MTKFFDLKRKNVLNLKNTFKNINFKGITLLLLIFLFGLYYYINSYIYVENMENQEKKFDNKCGNVLLEKDGKILLFNTNKEKEEGKNPIEFNDLEEYKEHLEWQKSKGINCPVLFLQYAKDTQNNDILQVKPNVLNNSGGLQPNRLASENANENAILNATLDSTPGDFKFNSGMHSGFDQYNQNIGLKTVLDHKFKETNADGKSRNPYDRNWGGKSYTKQALERGDYKDREVYRYKNQNINTNFDKQIR